MRRCLSASPKNVGNGKYAYRHGQKVGKNEKIFQLFFILLLTNGKVCGIIDGTVVREIERHHIISIRRSTQVGRRGAPAKGVGRVISGARVQISPSPPTKTEHLSTDKCSVFVYPSRRLGISSPREARCISSAPAGLYLITRQRVSACGLMIYRIDEETYKNHRNICGRIRRMLIASCKTLKENIK